MDLDRLHAVSDLRSEGFRDIAPLEAHRLALTPPDWDHWDAHELPMAVR